QLPDAADSQVRLPESQQKAGWAPLAGCVPQRDVISMHPSSTTRRGFLAGIAAAGLFAEDANLPAGITLRIAPVKLEVAPGRFVDTVGYNGSVPGPLIRFRENETVTIDIFNDTDAP